MLFTYQFLKNNNSVPSSVFLLQKGKIQSQSNIYAKPDFNINQLVIIIQINKDNMNNSFAQLSKNKDLFDKTSFKIGQTKQKCEQCNKNQQNSEKIRNEPMKIQKKLSKLIQNFNVDYLSKVNLSPSKIIIQKQKDSLLQKKDNNFDISNSLRKQENREQKTEQTYQKYKQEFNSQKIVKMLSEKSEFICQTNEQQIFVEADQFISHKVKNYINLNPDQKFQEIKQKLKSIKQQIMKLKLKKSTSTVSSSPKSSFSPLQIDLLAYKNNLCQSIILNQGYNNNLTIESFQIISFLGQGIYGKVLLAKDKNTNFLVALKQISKFNMSAETSSYLAREIKIQSFLNHPNIVQLYNFFDDQDYIYLILQICNSGNLYSYMLEEGPLPQKKTKQIVRQICEAIDYLHKNDIIHRDLKPENILLHNNVIKLCDFGWAVQSPLSRGTLCGTPIYASPELVLKQQNYDTKIDIWNIGIMTYEFLFGFTPFNIKQEKDLQKVLFEEVQFPENILVTDCCKDFILKCLRKDAKKRCSIIQLKDHQFLRAQ